MNRRKLIALLVILGLLTGLISHVPVVRAAYYHGVDAMSPLTWLNTGSGNFFIWGAGGETGGDACIPVPSGSCTLDGIAVQAWYPVIDTWSGLYQWDVTGISIFLGTGTLGFQGDGNYHTLSWTGGSCTLASGYADATFNAGTAVLRIPASGYDGPITGYIQLPLSVTIDSGPMAVDLVDGGTWHATATEGSGGYTYAWAYWSFETVPNYNAGTGQTFAHVFPAGIWTVGVKATDSSGATVYTTITVTAASVIGSYEAHFTRSGAYGQYMSVYVTDTAGNYVTISSTANTNFGIYATSGGEFGWVNADYEAVQFVTYTWRWTMSGNFGGATSPPPADFWLWSSIHLAVPNVDLVVNHHFVSLSDTYNTWSGPEGNPLTPETPPVPTSVLPDWLQAVYDMFVRLFKALFQPDATEFGKQLAGSWVTIASPVPSITPQYTIPFPNPNHLLAPTGDSVNIDFSGIMSYSGYSTYKLIVQVFLDAILVFVVIALVT